MTEHQAQRFANLVLGVAAAGAAIYIVRTPALRGLAWGLLRAAATTTQVWLVTEARRAWQQGASSPGHGNGQTQPGGNRGI